MAKFTVHGFEFLRLGDCQQCGSCGCDKEPCPHLTIKDDLFHCTVYGSRDLVCSGCFGEEGITHEGCIRFPDNPWIGVVRDGLCGYWFVRADGGSMDDLPFLHGEPYQLNR